MVANPILTSVLGVTLYWACGFPPLYLLYFVSAPLMFGLLGWWCVECYRESFEN
jgi:hypothetical protein